MLGNEKGKKRTEHVSDYVVFDLETTGTSCLTDQVAEISAIKVVDHQVVDEFSTLVNPERRIPYYATEVNGITDDMVADAPTFDTALYDFIQFIGDLPLVGHNIHTFDLPFIYRDSEKYFGKVPGNDFIDTLKISRMCLPELDSHRLTDLADHFGISTDGAHRALNDCRMNQQIYEKLGEMLETRADTFRKCPKCGNYLVKRTGKYGPFWGCSSYPDCKHTEKVIQP